MSGGVHHRNVTHMVAWIGRCMYHRPVPCESARAQLGWEHLVALAMEALNLDMAESNYQAGAGATATCGGHEEGQGA